jgi:prepilin-type N-terminal cleavage/methylation domain-containing protein
MSFEFRVSSFESTLPCRRKSPRFRAPSTRNPKPETRNRTSAFTLIELLVVIGIMALVMAIGIPFMANVVNGGKGISRGVRDVQQVCSDTRALAILRQSPVELRIHPADGTFDIGSATAETRAFSPDVAGNDWRMPDRPTSGGGGGGPIELPEGVGLSCSA